MSAPYATVVVSYPGQPDREGESLSGTLSSILWGARSVTITIVPDARAGGRARGAALLAGLSADLQRGADPGARTLEIPPQKPGLAGPGNRGAQ